MAGAPTSARMGLSALALVLPCLVLGVKMENSQEPDAAEMPVSAVAETVKQMDQMLEAQRKAMDPSDPLAKLKEELAATVWLREQLEEKDNDMKEEIYRGKIAIAQQAVAKETTPGVAMMLGDMRREMHSLAAPFYSKVLKEQIASLEAKEKGLLAQIEQNQPKPEPKAAAVEEPEAPAPVVEKPEDEEEEEEPKAKESTGFDWTKWLWVIAAVVVGIVIYFVMAKKNPVEPPGPPPTRSDTRQEV